MLERCTSNLKEKHIGKQEKTKTDFISEFTGEAYYLSVHGKYGSVTQIKTFSRVKNKTQERIILLWEGVA